MKNKTYKLDVMEKRTYYHDVIIQIEDDADIDAICNRVEEALNNLHGDIRNIDYTTGVKVVDIFEDESPKCECEVLDYKELLMFSKMKALPSAQPEPPWILCSERMPEEHEWLGTKKFGTTISDEVYVTFENEKGEKFCKHLSFQNGELSRYDKAYMDAWYKGSKPIAWMPLPKPFEGGIK